MIYLFGVLLTLFVVLQLEAMRKQRIINIKQSNINKFVHESLTEIETYAYVDIRELNDYLTKIKKKYGELND